MSGETGIGAVQGLEVGDRVRTPAGNVAEVIRLDEQLRECVVRRAHDAELVSFRWTWLRPVEEAEGGG